MPREFLAFETIDLILSNEFASKQSIAITRIRRKNKKDLRFPEVIVLADLRAEIAKAIDEGHQYGGDMEIYLPTMNQTLVGHHDGVYWLKETV